MNKAQEIDQAIKDATAQIKALQDFVDELLRENKAENTGFIALLLGEIRKRNTFH